MNHRAFLTIPFARWLRRSPLSERELCAAIRTMMAGLIDADLGGRVFKQRVAAPGRGKRGSTRVLIGTNLGERWFFLFGFEKNERDDIDDRELAALQKLAATLPRLDVGTLQQQLETGILMEICHETKSHTH